MPLVPTRFHPRGEALAADATGRTTRVFGGIPGEAAEVRVLGRGGHEDYAEWVRAAEGASPERVAPPCRHYRACGGCPWMHLDAAAGRAWRRRRVADALAEAGVVAEVEDVVPCPDGDLGYRHVAKLVAAPLGKGARLGAYGRHSHEVVGIEGCSVLHPALREWTGMRLPVGEGLRHVVVRRSRSSGAVLATVVARRDGPEVRRAVEGLPADGVHLHVNDRPGDAIFGPGPTVRVRGVDTIEERIVVDGRATTLAVGPTDFFQTNPSTASRLWADLPRPEGAMLDLFCGVGAASLVVGGERVHGVEFSEGAVARARENARRNGRDGVTFSAGAVATAEIPAGFEGATVLVNPPRSGLGEAVVARVVALRPRRLVYVSCEPRTLARDLVGLCAAGLVVVSVRPYDMFPQTAHVETVVVMERG